jgi:hypothetical protein
MVARAVARLRPRRENLHGMPRIIMNRAFIARWTRMPHSTGRLSASASSHPSLSSAAFITNIAESDFRHAQDELSVSAVARLRPVEDRRRF